MLENVGAMASAVAMENEQRKEHRRLRTIAKESPDVLRAMAQSRAFEQSEERKRRRRLNEDNHRAAVAAKLAAEVDEAKAALQAKKAQILHLENVLEAKHAVQNFPLSGLGHQQKLRWRTGAEAAS